MACEAFQSEKVLELCPWQVWDERGCFFLGLQPTKQRYKGRVIYKDDFGRRLTIAGSL